MYVCFPRSLSVKDFKMALCQLEIGVGDLIVFLCHACARKIRNSFELLKPAEREASRD